MQSVPNSDVAIRIRGLSKSYTIQKGGLEKQSTLTESALARIRHPFKRAEKESFRALKDINLDIKKGEVVGIIGRNGAGKSTLLKVLSRITYPTTGLIEIYGRVGSLLEVGTGFHPELTGRENIYLNGAILGMSRPEITREFDAIVDFAGVERFLDTPVKRYSSGMYVRLAFSVAAHMRTEILIVDEVLAVGDAEFQKKCLGKMQHVAKGEGRTVLFVSHVLANIETLCHSAVLLQNGAISSQGCTESVVDSYMHSTIAPTNYVSQDISADEQTSGIRLSFDHPRTIIHRCGDNLALGFEVHSNVPINRLTVGIKLCDMSGAPIVSMSSKVQQIDTASEKASQAWNVTVNLGSVPLNSSDYTGQIYIGDGGFDIAKFSDAFSLNVQPYDVFGWGASLPPAHAWGKVYWAPGWIIKSTNTAISERLGK